MFDLVNYALGGPVLYDRQTLGSAEPEEKLSMSVHLLSAILRVTRWERLLIAQPCEATHDADRYSVASARQ